MSTVKNKKERFAGLGVRKNERPEEVPTITLTESITNIENNIPINTNIEINEQNFNDKNNYNLDTSIELRGRKKSNKASYKSVTFNVEQNLHRDFKIMSANLGVSMVDMLDEALRLYMNIRNRENLIREFENGKTVTDIVYESLPDL